VTELPQFEEALRQAAGRRYGRPAWPRRLRRAALVAAAVAGLVVGLLSISRTPSDDEQTVDRPVATSTTIKDAAHRYTVPLPAGWRRADESLTPDLQDPVEIFSAGTFQLHYRRGRCNHMPDGALETMRPTDAFVSLQERSVTSPPTTEAGFPPRPTGFGEARPQPGSDIAVCGNAKPEPVVYWLPFRDAGRAFYAIVVLGSQAAPETRRQAFGILDGFRFEPG